MSASTDINVSVRPLSPPVVIPDGAGVPNVRVGPTAFADMWEHVGRDMANEAGGLLLGDIHVGNDCFEIEVIVALPAENAVAGPASLRFTHESWQLLRENRKGCHPGLATVGWYHSHPGMGIFLSYPDCHLHREVFANQPWCVALVLDPVNHAHGFFWQAGTEMVPCPTDTDSAIEAPLDERSS